MTTMARPVTETPQHEAEDVAAVVVRLADDYVSGRLDADTYFAEMDRLAHVAIRQEIDEAAVAPPVTESAVPVA